jgi:hypothetical protein
VETLPNNPPTFAYLSLLLMHKAMALRLAVLMIPLAAAWLLQRQAVQRAMTDVWYVLAGFYLGLILIPPRLEVFWFDTLWVLLAYAAASIAILNWRDPQNPRA